MIERLTNPRYLLTLRKKVAYQSEGKEYVEKDEDEEEGGEASTAGGDGATVTARKQRKRKSSDDESGENRKVVRRRRKRQNNGEDGENSEQAKGEGDGGEYVEKPKPAKGRRRIAKLKLDDALAVKEQNGQFAGWSEARIRAFKLIKQNPNAYYYRFNAPGEAQKNGAWSKVILH